MSIDQHIEELRAELRNAVYRDERRWIEDELAMALAEREVRFCCNVLNTGTVAMRSSDILED